MATELEQLKSAVMIVWEMAPTCFLVMTTADKQFYNFRYMPTLPREIGY